MTKGGRSAGRGTDQTKSPILSGEMDKTRPAYNADGINGEEGMRIYLKKNVNGALEEVVLFAN